MQKFVWQCCYLRVLKLLCPPKLCHLMHVPRKVSAFKSFAFEYELLFAKSYDVDFPMRNFQMKLFPSSTAMIWICK